MVRRYDRGEFRTSTKKQPNGWLLAAGSLTRAGIFQYRNADGSVRKELRLPEDVFHQDSLESYPLIPITDEHPEEMLTAENTAKYQKGTIGYVRRDGDFLDSSLLFTDASLIKKIESGEKVELSCGYDCDLVVQPGIWKGQHYDLKQTNIRPNHVAVVERGRAGPQARIRLDAADAVMLEGDTVKVTVDGKDYEVTQAVVDQIVSLVETGSSVPEPKVDEPKMDAQDKQKYMNLQKEYDSLKGRMDALTSKDAEENRRMDSEKQRADIERGVRERIALENKASSIIKDYKFDGKTDRQIREDVIKHFAPTANVTASHSDAYVQARYDSEIDRAPAEAVGNVRRTAENENSKTPEVRKDSREKMIEGSQNAYKTPLAFATRRK